MRRETFGTIDTTSTMINLVKYLNDRNEKYKESENSIPYMDYMNIKYRLDRGDRNIHGVIVTGNNRFHDYHHYTYCEKWKNNNISNHKTYWYNSSN